MNDHTKGTAGERESSDGPCAEADGCPTELAVLQRFWRAQQAGEAVVSAREVFRIAGGDVECEPNPTPERALEVLRDLRQCYDEALDTTPADSAPLVEGAEGSNARASFEAWWYDEGYVVGLKSKSAAYAGWQAALASHEGRA
jgi:hypothetical protein